MGNGAGRWGRPVRGCPPLPVNGPWGSTRRGSIRRGTTWRASLAAAGLISTAVATGCAVSAPGPEEGGGLRAEASASPEAEASPQSGPATSPRVPAPRATATARDTVRPDPVRSSVLPRRVVAGYWQAWGHPSVRLRDVPRDYDLVMVSFATGDSDGTLRFSQSVQSPASFAADMRALRATDRRVLLSVGGWRDGGLEIRSAAQLRVFLRSVSAIIDAHHFQGLDWDLEHGIDPARVAEATRWLKARYGPDFLITMAPVLDPGPEREQLDLALRIRGALDMVSLQFYNTGHGDTAWIVDRALLWARAVGEDKVAMAFMTVPTRGDTGELSPAVACGLWRDLVRRAPRARGVVSWSVNLDSRSGYAFARACGKVVHADSA